MAAERDERGRGIRTPMAQEIERKFLVRREVWKPVGAGTPFRQGYLSAHKERVVRVRIAGGEARLTVKGATVGLTRSEFEYAIPVADAAAMLDGLCERPLIEKERHVEVHGGKTWEIDVFHGENEGLVVAELELAAEDEPFSRPAWLGEEVSADPRYANANLARNPFSRWGR
jgi:CYTH domain-containing protein